MEPPASVTRTGPRLAASSLAVGGGSALFAQMLHLSALNQADGSVFGIPHDYYARWSVIPLLLVLHGLVRLHRHQEARYGRLGRLGFQITFGGYAILLVHELSSHVLFPSNHPLQFIGFLLGAGLFVVIGGWVTWGVASSGQGACPSGRFRCRSRSASSGLCFASHCTTSRRALLGR